jgi:hypothetical protein
MPDCVEQLGRKGRYLVVLNFREPLSERVTSVARDELLFHGAGEGRAEDSVNVAPPGPR